MFKIKNKIIAYLLSATVAFSAVNIPQGVKAEEASQTEQATVDVATNTDPAAHKTSQTEGEIISEESEEYNLNYYINSNYKTEVAVPELPYEQDIPNTSINPDTDAEDIIEESSEQVEGLYLDSSGWDIENYNEAGLYHKAFKASFNIAKYYVNNFRIEYRWYALRESDNTWLEIKGWNSSNSVEWTPDRYGSYIITCMVRQYNKPDTMSYISTLYDYSPYIQGICQMPYTGEGGGYLIGISSDNAASVEMLILDCTLYMQGLDAWVYTTGRCGLTDNGLWTVWQPKYGYFWTLFRAYDEAGNMVDERCYGFANIGVEVPPAENREIENIWPGYGNDNPADVTKYSYEIIPLLAPFNDYYYVKTDNPYPGYIRFVDKDSKYYTDDEKSSDAPCAIRYSTYRYSDVEYEDYETGRVKGGYIFVRDTGYNMDGGELSLQQANDEYVVKYYNGYYTSNSPKYTDTGITVSCPEVKSSIQYLIDNYTSSDKDFFENMNSVSAGLHSLALYPKGVSDTSKPYDDPYPCLCVSPYYELGLNDHYETMYQSGNSVFFEAVHPYVLHSTSFPGTLVSVAKALEPDCEVTSGGVHYLIKVTYNGETRSYGGAGSGTYDNFYSKYIEKLYKFDGSSNDFAYYGTLSGIAEKYNDYQAKTEAELDIYKSQLRGDIFQEKTKGGTWIRVGIEGSSGVGYAYICDTNGYSSSVEDAWVDGRFINDNNCWYKGAHFGDTYNYGSFVEDSAKADIIIRNKTFVDYYGNTVTRDVRYEYNSSTDDWRAPYSYVGRNWYSSSMVLPDYMILTKDQVQAMVDSGEIDKNTDTPPEHGLIYDGSAEPGTAF